MKRLIPITVLALVIATCSTGSDNDVATLEGGTETSEGASSDDVVDAEEALLEFTQCMRDNGVSDFPDPELDENGNLQLFRGGGGGQGGPGGLGADQGTLQAAFEECGDRIEGVIQNNFRDFDQTEFQDAFLEFAVCMREQGVDMPDPDFSGGFGPGGGGLFGDIDPQDPAFQEAAEQCQGIFEGGFGTGGGGFGRGGLGGGGS